MIICPEHNLMIITPPKTASTSLHAYAATLGGQTFYGQQPDGRYSRHALTVPDEALAFATVALVIRNPWDRLVSLFHSLHASEGYFGRPGLGFLDFADRATRNPGHHTSEELPFFYRATCAEYAVTLTAAGLAFELWAVEHLADHLAQHGLGPEPGRLLRVENASFRRKTPAYYPPEIEHDGHRFNPYRAAWLRWAGPDCHLLAMAPRHRDNPGPVWTLDTARPEWSYPC